MTFRLYVKTELNALLIQLHISLKSSQKVNFKKTKLLGIRNALLVTVQKYTFNTSANKAKKNLIIKEYKHLLFNVAEC